MRTMTRVLVGLAVAAWLATSPLASAPAQVPLYQQYLSPASPQEVVACLGVAP